jgi:hypothetical protein
LKGIKSVIFTAVMLLALFVGGGVYASSLLNQTVPASVTITAPPPTQVVLYNDILCATPFTGTLAFSSTDTSGTPFATVYFRSSEISPATIGVTSTLAPSAGVVGFIVGTPSSVNAYHGCPIIVTIAPAGGIGTFNFNVTVTGTS